MTAAVFFLALLFVAPASAEIRHKGIFFEAAMDPQVRSLPPHSVHSLRFRLRNDGPDQTIRVICTGSITLTREQRLKSGEEWQGFLYFPPTENGRFYGSLYFTGSVSGTPPNSEWQHVYFEEFEESKAPRGFLVGRHFDIAELESIYPVTEAQKFYARLDAAGLPDSWLGYVGIDFVALEREEAERLGARTKEALQDWVLAGGRLLLSGDETWCRSWWGGLGQESPGAGFAARYGQGEVRRFPEDPGLLYHAISQGVKSMVGQLSDSEFLLGPSDWQRSDYPDIPRVPYKLLWWLVLLMAVLSGPVLYGFLRKRERLATFLVAAPACSFAGGLLLLLAFWLIEGFPAKGVAASCTFLYEKDRRALEYSRIGLYSARARDLAFPAGACVRQREHNRSEAPIGASGISLRQDGEQTIWSGALPPRLARAFGCAVVRPERARVLLNREGDGYRAVNGFGVEIREILYFSTDEKPYMAGSTAPGQSSVLHPVTESEMENFNSRIRTFLHGRFDLQSNSYAAFLAAPLHSLSPHPSLEFRHDTHLVIGEPP